MDTIHITFCTDINCCMPAGVMMQSICTNNPDQSIDFHVIVDESVGPTEQEDFSAICKPFERKHISFYHVKSADFTNLPSLGTFGTVTQATFYRLILPTILPSSVQKVLYLDCDIIVRHSLLPLWEIDLDDYALGAVIDPQEATPEKYERLGYPSQHSYFNAGVLIINLDYWRRHSAVRLFKNYIQEHRDDILFHDQDVLNAVFHDQWKHLPISYNLTSGFLWNFILYDKEKYQKEVFEALKDPVILHFTGHKPWEFSMDPNPYSSTFQKYKRMTKWRNTPKIDQRPLKLKIVNTIANALRKIGLKKERTLYATFKPID